MPPTPNPCADDAQPAVSRLEGVGFAYGGSPFTLEVEAFELRPGEHVACIGPSGTGKTTLVGLISGLLQPTRGEVQLVGERLDDRTDAERRARRARDIGMVFQELELLEHLTAMENVLLPYLAVPSLRLDGAARERARDLAERVGLADKIGRRPRRLSQGERQRVALARALVTEPKLVLGDEPTGNLDPETGGRVLDLLLDETRRTGAALLMVTHDHGILDRFDRVVDVREFAR